MLAGLVILVLPGIEAPILVGSALMLTSGIACGIYSLFGRGVADPAATTTGYFLRVVLLAVTVSLLALPWMKLDASGLVYVVLSGALASGLGYVLWYRVLQHMRAITASTVQLSAPVLASVGWVVLLDEKVTPNSLIASVLILGSIGLVLRFGKSSCAASLACPFCSRNVFQCLSNDAARCADVHAHKPAAPSTEQDTRA